MSGGVHIVAAFESLEHHATAYEQTHKGVTVHRTPVEGLTRSNLRKLGVSDIDIVVGGPPCQPFSMAGKRRGRKDARGTLVESFVNVVKIVKPRAFVMENVPGMRSIHRGKYLPAIVDSLKALGYHVSTPHLLNAADYGVPQFRRRLFICGARERALPPEAPRRTHGDPRIPELLNHLRPYITVSDAIFDLPGSTELLAAEIEDTDRIPYEAGASNSFQRAMRRRRLGVTGNGVSLHFEHIVRLINNLPFGGEDPATRYRRLYPDRPAFTLRAGSGSFTALRPIHPTLPRVITIREAARLQSFPDYVTFSPIKKWAYQQIGNAVPPLLARAVAEYVMESL